MFLHLFTPAVVTNVLTTVLETTTGRSREGASPTGGLSVLLMLFRCLLLAVLGY
jgi:hypothetical protein